MRLKLSWLIILLIVFGMTSLAEASSAKANSTVALNQLQLLTKPEPVSEAFMLSLAADDFDKQDERVKPEKTSKNLGSFKSKSRVKAIALAALLPGAGELYLGNKKRARMFFVAEALIVAGYVSYRLAANEKQDDLLLYAETYAGADMAGKSDEFLDMVGFYTDNDHYNSEGRVGDPHRPFYPDNSTYHWRWQSEAEMSTYRELKNRQGQLIQKSNFVLTMAVVNRLVSVINTAISSRHSTSGGGAEFAHEPTDSIRLSFQPVANNRQLVLTWHTKLF